MESTRPVDDTWPLAESVPVRRPNTSTVPLDQSVGLYDEVGHALIMLNPSAAAIWERCDGLSSAEQMVEVLAKEHAVDETDIRDDVWRTLHKLATLGLVSDLRD
jgi:hypothetical protein